jgi:hypothetical protein
MQKELNQVWRTNPGGAAPRFQQVSPNDKQIKAQAMVPILDWPPDLFDTFTADFEDCSADGRIVDRLGRVRHASQTKINRAA